MATIYLSSLNATDQLDVLAEFNGSKVPLPATTVPIVPTANAGTIDLTALQAALKFKTSHMSGATNEPGSIVSNPSVAPSDLTTLAKGVMPASTVGVGSKLGLNTRPNTAFLGQLSKEIFGSEHSADLFNNQKQLSDKYVEACDNLHFKFEQSTNALASQEAVNALMLEKSERFALKYKVTAPNPPDASKIHTAVLFTGATSGVTKEVTVETDANGAVHRMTKENEGAFRPTSYLDGVVQPSNKYVLDQMKVAANNAGTQACVRGIYTVTPTVKRLNGATPQVWISATPAIPATFDVDVAGSTNFTIESVTVNNIGSGYNINDVLRIAAGSLGTGSPIIEFTVKDAMLIGNRFKNNVGLLTAFQSRFIGNSNSGAHNATALATYGTALNAIEATGLSTTTAQGSGTARTGATEAALILKANGSTGDTLTEVVITNAGNQYTAGNILTITPPTANQVFADMGAVAIELTDAMISGGNTLQLGANGDLLAAIKVKLSTGLKTTVPANKTYTKVALQTPQGSGAVVSVTVGGATNNTITAVDVTTPGSNYVIGQLIRIPAGALGTDSAAISVTLTINMIGASGSATAGHLVSHSDLLAAVKTAGGGGGAGELYTVSVGSPYTGIAVQSSHHGKGAEIEVTLNGPLQSAISKVIFTKHGSGYRRGDTVIVPATTLGATSTEIKFQVTEQMLMHSGGISANLPSVDLTAVGTNGTVTVTQGTSVGNWKTDGQGIGATFTLNMTDGKLVSIVKAAVGSGFRNGDKITFLRNNGQAGHFHGADYEYTIGAASDFVTKKFLKDEAIASAVGPGEAVGGVGGTNDNAVVSIANLNTVQVAMLNESLDEPTEIPLEANDKIQSLYKITSKSGQTNSSDHPVTIDYTAIFEFLLS